MAPCFYNFKSGTVESGNTVGYLPRYAKLALHGGWRGTGLFQSMVAGGCPTVVILVQSNKMPETLKCQINNEKSQIFPNSNLDHLGKTGTTSQLHFFAMHKLYL